MTAGAHILVVDDEAEIRAALVDYLGKHGFAVSPAADATEARAVLERRAVDLAILDLRMPGEDGLSLARHIRQTHTTAIVMLTASADTIDRVVGLELGADDYLAKPFDPRELLARIRSVLRRTSAPPPVEPARTVRIGCCVFDRTAMQVFTLTGENVPVTAGELRLLEVFAERPNRVLSRDQLLELAQRNDSEPFDRSIDSRIARLRRKVEAVPDLPESLKTVRGLGYIFVPTG